MTRSLAGMVTLIALLALAPSSARAARLLDLRADPALATGMTSLTAAALLPARKGAPARVIAAGYGGAVLLTPRRGQRPAITPVTTTVSVLALAAADLDRDHHLDVALVGARDGRYVLQICWGEPGGGLAPGLDVTSAELGPAPESTLFRGADLALGDVTGDGRPDLVASVSGTGSQQVLVLAGEAPREFRALARLPTEGRLLIADADGDGRADVLVSGRPWSGDGRGAFVPAKRRETPAFTVLADLDGDGRRDLVNAYGRQNVVVQRGRARGFGRGVTQHRPIEGAAQDGISGASAGAGDLDGDGRAELALYDGDGIVWVLRGARSAPPGRATVYGFTDPDSVGDVAAMIVDADRDGRADVLIARNDGSIVVLRNRGSAPHAVARVDKRPVYIAAERVALVYVRCTRGVGACDTSITVASEGRRRTNDLYLDPGERDYATVPVAAAGAGAPVRVTVTPVAGRRVERTVRLRASTAAQRRAYCTPGGLDISVVARSATVVVLGSFLGQFAVACDLRTARSTAIDLQYPDGPFAVRGRWVAGMGRQCGEGLQGCVNDVVVTDLRTERTRSEALNLPRDDCSSVSRGGDCGSSFVLRVVVGRHGQVAWVDCSEQPTATDCPPGPRSILRFDAGGVRVVATSPEIDARSLRASPSGRAFAWTQGETTRDATWAGPPPKLR